MSDKTLIDELLASWEHATIKPAPEELCRDHPEFLQQVRESIRRLEAMNRAIEGEPTATSTNASTSTSPSTPPHPKYIGPFHLLEILGEGGMGTVYRAEQSKPIRRVVALKLIKLGFDSREVVARFASERQAMARMDHPGIAKVLDAGITETGRPYFVMEYVPGIPITRFCDAHQLTVRQRLELFTQVCDAISHAHTKAILHRDIKSSNVLAYMLDGKPHVRVIDFGIAKAMDTQRLGDETIATELGRVIGTYETMSPEQADGDQDVDTRSDVYSLGVLLYEMLSGAKPFDRETLHRAAEQEVRRLIREVDPPRPSTRLSSMGGGGETVARLRRTRLDQLTRDLRRELEWIPLKAMHKDRDRRYVSAQSMAQDIENYLKARPLLAGPESAAYNFRKYVVRNAAGVAAAVAALCLLGGATWIYLHGVRVEQAHTKAALREAEYQRQESQRQEHEAKLQAAIANATNQFLSDMLGSADPSNLLGDKVTVLQAVQAAITELDGGKLKDQPLTEASVRETIGATLQSLGKYDAAEPNLEKALELQRKVLPAGHASIAASLNSLGTLLRDQSKADEAELLLREALEVRRGSLPAGHLLIAQSLANLSVVLKDKGKLEDAERLAREALAIRRAALPADHADVALTLNNLAVLLAEQSRFSDAEDLYRQALSMRRNTLPAGHPEIAQTMNNLATLLYAEGKLADAEPLFRESLGIRLKALPAGHPDLAQSLNNLAVLRQQQGDLQESEELYRKVLEDRRRTLASSHPLIAQSLSNLGTLLRDRHKYADAEPMLREALMVWRETLPPGHKDIAIGLNNLAQLLRDQQKNTEAESLNREALEIWRNSLPPQHPNIAHSLNNLAIVLIDLGRLAEAEGYLREALEIRRNALPEGQAKIAESLNNLGLVLHAKKKLPEAEPLFREALELRRRALPAGHLLTAQSLGNLAALLKDQGKLVEAEPLYREALEIRKAKLGIHDRTAVKLAEDLSNLLDTANRHDEALLLRTVFGLQPAATRPTSGPSNE